MPPKSHEAAWSKALFPDDASTVSREAFEAAFLDADAAAVDAAWRSLTTAPPLTRSGMASKLRQLARGRPGVDEAAVGDAVRAAAAAPVAEHVDYEAMEAADLKALCRERGIARPPPVKRLVIEELRFYDAHGRPGKRHPATKKLS